MIQKGGKRMFPAASECDTTSKAGKKDPVNLSVKLLGNRIHNDQTLPEYLIEFLLIFCSPKEKNVNSPEHNGAMRFHTPDEVAQGLLYYVNTRVGLRRFIFYGRSKQDSRSDMDTFAYEELKKRLEDACENSPDDVLLMHDLLQSYAVVTRNRGWYAQALLPVVPQFIIPDLQGIRKRDRKSVV